MKPLAILLVILLFSSCDEEKNQSSKQEKQIMDYKEAARAALPSGSAQELVIANCVHCHSHQVFTQNRATREGWKDMIVWMQQTQGLWPLGPAEEEILDYLAAHFAPGRRGRRSPLTDIEWYQLTDQE